MDIIDPQPKNRGAGLDLLRQAGIGVTVGIPAAELERAPGPYLHPLDGRACAAGCLQAG